MMAMRMTGRACMLLMLALSSQHSLSEHKLELEGRARTAHVDALENNGKAASLLLTARVHSDWHSSLSTVAELTHVETFWRSSHTNGVRFNGRPFIPDVPSTEVNQLYLRFEAGEFESKIGRQKIEIDNQRFVGSNDFWQNDQTFDAIELQYRFLSASKARYFYIGNANRIFGDSASDMLRTTDSIYEEAQGLRPVANLGDHEQDTHLMHVEIGEWDFSSLRVMYLDIDNSDAPQTSNTSWGLHLGFEKRITNLQYRAELEFARQKRVNVVESNPRYARLELGLGRKSTELTYRYERLGSDAGQSFITPLASLHDFHGWADKFGSNFGQGIVDQSVKLSWRKSPIKIDARYHWFEAEKSGTDWGQEFDLDVIFKLNSKHRFLLRYADYFSSRASSARFPSETRIYLNYSFSL